MISIILLLLEHKKISATKLAEMFEVTPRTIFRDIDTLNAAGVPIITYPGVNGGISIMETYKIEKKLFTISDISTLLIGLGSIHSTLSNEEILNTLLKVKGLLPAEQIKNIELKLKQISIDNTPWFSGKNLRLKIDNIRLAINENRFISFQYYDSIGKKRHIKVEPYRLVLKNSNWYLQGYCTTKKKFRIFRLPRITSFKLFNETFLPRELDYESLDISFKTNNKISEIKLLVHESILDFMIEFCGEDKIVAYGDDKFIVYFPFIEDDYWYNTLLHFGNKCECLEPENVRLEIFRRVEVLYDMYKSVRKQTE